MNIEEISKFIKSEFKMYDEYTITPSISKSYIKFDIQHTKGNKSNFLIVTIKDKEFNYNIDNEDWEEYFDTRLQLKAIQDMFNIVEVLNTFKYKILKLR